MCTSYYTVKSQAVNEFQIQNSKFIAHIKRVESEKEAQEFIESINREHWKANHNCFAYVIGENQHIQKASDDGEPSGTAGVPILEVIKKKNLRDTVVVVTRYFGGVKLGAGGLIRAYSRATTEGLQASGIVERIPMKIMQSTFDYTQLGSIENALRKSSYIIKEIHYAENVSIDIYVKENETPAFIDWITNLSNGQAVTQSVGAEYLEQTVN
ncbi:putative YigZ family protein [Scopulibacillus darangshiensis]|uniref:Putative YigZ family protein n=1 Tax=Scopulibacillus darangshiensis TaxID=442528 RepID=A0A4R2NVA1_9BACL|nr:YigZ family protein [Scopulibacillus darangshiensis]TCP26019.1 putative YigZ family protein [Scopulibacillus darangshiensis]